MSSILTNTSALTALQNLRSTQSSLSKTQNQISTGLRVSSAADNATNWSVSSQMKSDNGVISVVQDGLKNSNSMLKTATGALDKIKDAVDKVKQQLMAASQVTNGDYTSINATLKQLGEQLKDAVKGASYNGQNLLDGTLRTDGQSINIVAGFHQAASGATTNATISKMTLTLNTAFQTGAVTTTGETITGAGRVGALEAIAEAAIAATPVTTIDDTSSDDGTATVAYTAGESSFTITKNVNGTEVKTSYTALDADGNAVAIDATGTPNRFATKVTVGSGTATSGLLVQGTGTGRADLANLQITATNQGALDTIMANADRALKEVTKYAATLGGVQARIESQQDFLKTLQDSLTNGVSALVDADMNETSTRLQALQTQQQLGVQSLSIANQNSQMILKLFQ